MANNFQLIEDDEALYWQYGDYLSAPYRTLEKRPWSPILINRMVCFVAGNGKQHCVVLDKEEGEWFEDIYDLTDDHGIPLYIAQNNTDYLVVRGTQKSEDFPFQITYEASERGIAILRFDTWKPWKGDKAEDMALAFIDR